MNSAELQKLAQQACFATNYQTKSNAQQYFYNLCQHISPADLENLINNYSPTVLFVMMEYMYKILNIAKNQKAIFQVINNSAENWFTNTARFVRKDNKQFQLYVENSIGRTLGQCMRSLYLNTELRDWIKTHIKQRPNPRYRLYLWKNFIESVSSIDRNNSFLQYRALVYNFQQVVIPLIVDSLLPYFQSVKQQIQINQLSSNISTNLNVSDINRDHNDVLVFTVEQQKFAGLVLNLLKEVICFNYNITYSQYQEQKPIQNCLICFPDQVTKKIVTKQFIESIFYVTEKLAMDQPHSKFYTISLQCIQRLMLTRISYCTNTNNKESFIKHCMLGMVRLLNMKSLSQQAALSLIESNNKLLINVDIGHMYDMKDLFNEWICTLKNRIMEVISSASINFDNNLLNQCLELSVRVVSQAAISKLKEENHKFKMLGGQIFAAFVQALFNKEHEIVGNAKVKNFDDLKKNSNQFFKKIRNLCLLQPGQSLTLMLNIFMQILKGQNINSIANIFFMMAEFIELGIFDCNVLYDEPATQHFPKFGKIILLCVQWINHYRSFTQTVEIIQVSILIFIQRLVSQLLGSFVYQNKQLKINSRTYKAIKQNKPDINDQQFLTFCFKQFAISLSNGSYARVSYTFQVMGTLLLKFKWSLKRQSFKQTVIAKSVLDLCLNLTGKNFQGQLVKLRKKLYKIITNISFDDILDDYHQNIDSMINTLYTTLQQDIWKALYDLTGICQAIDISTIYRYFLVSLNKKIQMKTIMDGFFSSAGDNIEIITQILKLHLGMVQNKAHRLSGVKTIRINYHLFRTLIPYWKQFLPQAINDNWQEPLIYLYKIFATMVKGNHLNFFLLERVCPQYKQFVRNIFGNMNTVASWVHQYPQLYKQYRNIMNLITKQLLTVVFYSEDKDLVMYFNNLITIFIEFTKKELDDYLSGNTNVQNQLESSLQIMENIIRYLDESKQLTHKTVQIRNIQAIWQNPQIKVQYLLNLFGFGINAGKNRFKFIDKICNIIHHMGYILKNSLEIVIKTVGLSEARAKSLLEICEIEHGIDVDDNEEQNNKQFVYKLKKWFRDCDIDSMPEIIEY